LSCIFSEGNRDIDVVLTSKDDGFREVWRLKLDPEAPTKVSLTTTPEN
jgi:hypothetical protein